MEIKGYELRVAVVNLEELADYNKKYNDNVIVNNETNDNEFYAVAEEQGNVWSLGNFQEQFNLNELNLRNCLIRYCLCDNIFNEDETRQDIHTLTMEDTLIVEHGIIQQRDM